ncbi:glycosyltransferase [Xanthovirga aplysinae]|uniref:glycosyltransferase n=1 Tax=Xanthovirga aplysinae TaxID=2529853 RepID=UPI0012BD0DEC|nr:glycosyltransferase family 2 protein [Xanthovirga aplysinae]MTI32486.1 glycosyltransferase family 2 protein [Xanthovirga aplysinae]
MEISVIIPTFNRSHQIQEILDALEKQSLKKFEVVVVNDGSTDNTKEKIEELRSSYSFSLRVLNCKNGGRSVSRNIGAKAAKGELLIFYDDDTRPNPDSIRTHFEFHQQHNRAILDGPAYYDKSRYYDDFHYYRALIEHRWYGAKLGVSPKEKASINGPNFSISRTVFIEMGMLNEDLTDSEDFELAFRAVHQHNLTIYSDKRTWVYHDDYKNLEEYINRKYICSLSAREMIKKNPEILKLYASKYQFSPSFWKSPMFKFFRNQRWIKLLSNDLFRSFLPLKLRYKLYDLIITSNTVYKP